MRLIMIDQPRLFRDPNEVTRRETEIFANNVASLNTWVCKLQIRLGPNVNIPWFDPQDGGCEAQILWLLEAPGRKATREHGGSGFISCNNNDGTAQNTWKAREGAGVSRKLVVHWNVIPYYLGSSTKIRAYDPHDIAAVGPLLGELLDLLPRLRVVILGGKAANKVWRDFAPVNCPFHIIECPHPSPKNLNSRPWYREPIIKAWQDALKYVEGDK